MKKVTIDAVQFFELLKLKDTSMWEIFARMIDGEEKEIIFLDKDEQILFTYRLPATPEKLAEDQKAFATHYADKLSGLN